MIYRCDKKCQSGYQLEKYILTCTIRITRSRAKIITLNTQTQYVGKCMVTLRNYYKIFIAVLRRRYLDIISISPNH